LILIIKVVDPLVPDLIPFDGSVLEVIPSDISSPATTRLGVISFPHTKRELPI
jgi:hypothetical protein